MHTASHSLSGVRQPNRLLCGSQANCCMASVYVYVAGVCIITVYVLYLSVQLQIAAIPHDATASASCTVLLATATRIACDAAAMLSLLLVSADQPQSCMPSACAGQCESVLALCPSLQNFDGGVCLHCPFHTSTCVLSEFQNINLPLQAA